MRRRAAIVAATTALVLLTAGPAWAQYDGDGGTTSSSTSSTTTTAPASERIADVGPEVANPGDPVTVSTGSVFEPGSTAEVVFVRGQQGASGIEVAEVIVNADGTVDATFTVPSTTPPGVYFVYAEGVDENGNTIRATGVLVVLAEGQAPTDPPPAAASAAGTSETDGGETATGTESAGTTSAIVPPPNVQRLQLTEEAEQSLVDEVAAGDDTRVVIDGAQLSVENGQGSSSAPVTAGVAAGFLVLAGAIALRTRHNRH